MTGFVVATPFVLPSSAAAGSHLGDSSLDVDYEDLAGNPADTCARIFGFCGLDYDPAAIRHRFTTDEIGHWKHYEPFLERLRKGLGALAHQT
jgi:hypothetical protein